MATQIFPIEPDSEIQFNQTFGASGAGTGFFPFRPSPGSFVRLDDTHWQVTSQDGATQETITFANAANILASDYHFL